MGRGGGKRKRRVDFICKTTNMTGSGGMGADLQSPKLDSNSKPQGPPETTHRQRQQGNHNNIEPINHRDMTHEQNGGKDGGRTTSITVLSTTGPVHLTAQ